MDGLKYVLNKQQMRYRMRMLYLAQRLRWGMDASAVDDAGKEVKE